MVLCKEIPNVLGNAKNQPILINFFASRFSHDRAFPLHMKVSILESGGSNAARKPIAWGTVRKLEVRRAPWWPRLGDQTCWPSKNAISLNHRGRATFRGRFLPPNQQKNQRWRAVLTRPYGDIFGVFTAKGIFGPQKVGVNTHFQAVFAVITRKNAHSVQKASLVSKKTLETTLETAKARNNVQKESLAFKKFSTF